MSAYFPAYVISVRTTASLQVDPRRFSRRAVKQIRGVSRERVQSKPYIA